MRPGAVLAPGPSAWPGVSGRARGSPPRTPAMSQQTMLYVYSKSFEVFKENFHSYSAEIVCVHVLDTRQLGLWGAGWGGR